MNYFVAYSCKYLNFICEAIVKFFIEDFSTDRIDYELLFENFHHIPGGTSTRNINHWVQFYSTKEFKQYDYGVERNYMIYGQPTPPHYDLNKFKDYSIKSLMTTSDADPFSKIEDCQHLFQHLKPEVIKILDLEKYNHLDYLWSHKSSKELYTQVIQFLKEETK